MRDLNEIRKDITATDYQIKELFLKRMSLAEEVAHYKIQSGDKILKADREQELLDTMVQNLPENIRPNFSSVLKSTIRVSRKHQYEEVLRKQPEKLQIESYLRDDNPAIVCYQGLPASYQHRAARILYPRAQYEYAGTFEDVFRKVAEKQADVGIVPVENSTAGTINEVYDLLVKYNLYINRSHVCRIRHCLAGVPGTVFTQIHEVYSHPQALGQCSQYIDDHSFHANRTSNTAVAADFVSKEKNPAYAAICSPEAAEMYGLEILQENINDCKFNQTRFIAISRKLTAEKTDDRISMVFTIPHVCGSLSSTLSIFSDYESNLTEIHSRPQVDMPWTYRFYVDFSGNLLEDNIRCMLYQLIEELPFVKLLGCYQVSQSS